MLSIIFGFVNLGLAGYGVYVLFGTWWAVVAWFFAALLAILIDKA